MHREPEHVTLLRAEHDRIDTLIGWYTGHKFRVDYLEELRAAAWAAYRAAMVAAEREV